ncbi:hypothetical protein MMC13_004291 [Lambiella insularis]|nr:hypothetical protein [Lambiella insularis]
MPEIVIQSSHAAALEDAFDKVTNGGQFPWKFKDWTTNEKHKWNGTVNASDLPVERHLLAVYTGMRNTYKHHSHGWRNFTIRHDYDYAAGLQQDGGKGYHVNVELPDAKYAFVTSDGLRYAEDCWDFLSQRIKNDGEKAAAEWFMRSPEACRCGDYDQSCQICYMTDDMSKEGLGLLCRLSRHCNSSIEAHEQKLT